LTLKHFIYVAWVSRESFDKAVLVVDTYICVSFGDAWILL